MTYLCPLFLPIPYCYAESAFTRNSRQLLPSPSWGEIRKPPQWARGAEKLREDLEAWDELRLHRKKEFENELTCKTKGHPHPLTSQTQKTRVFTSTRALVPDGPTRASSHRDSRAQLMRHTFGFLKLCDSTIVPNNNNESPHCWQRKNSNRRHYARIYFIHWFSFLVGTLTKK